MHLVELRFDADRPVQLRLHHRLTAVVAPDPGVERIREVLARLWVLAGTEVDGVVDGGGYLTPLDPTAVVALDLDGEGLVVIGPDRVPPPDPTRREQHLRAAATARDAHQAEVERHTAAIDDLARRLEATAAAVEVGRTELDDSLSRRADLDAQRAAVDGRPEAIAGERDAALEAVAASRARIDELTDLRGRLTDLLGDGPASLRIGGDTAELVEVVERCGEVGGLSPTTLVEVTGWLRSLADGSAPVRPDAEELIRAEREIEGAWQEAAAAGVEGAPEVMAAMAARDGLVEDRDALEALARNGLLGDTARSEIEAAHGAVASARSHDQEAARAHEDRILNRFGFDSYLDFTIAMSTRSVGQKAEGKLQRVVDELAVAEEELGRARQAAADRLERLAAAREPVRERIAAYLGEWPDGPAEAVLCRIPAVPASAHGLVDEVDAALDAGRDELLRHTELVTDLDEEAAGLAGRLSEIDGQRAQVDARIAEIEGLLARAEGEVAMLRTRADEATGARRDAEAALAEAWRAHDELLDGTGAAYEPGDLDRVADVVADVVRAGGPGPVLLDDTFAPVGADLVPALARAVTARVPGVQLVYVTADPALSDWARGLSGDDGTGVVLVRRGWLARRFGRRGRPAPAS